jgi:hypothetical protein
MDSAYHAATEGKTTRAKGRRVIDGYSTVFQLCDFAMKSEGQLADRIPEGFEIYENPNAQVFLRRIPPKIITDEELMRLSY